MNRKVAGGRVWDLSRLACEPVRQAHAAVMPASKFLKIAETAQLPVISTPTEADFFAALGVPRWEPCLRTAQQLREYLSEKDI